MAKRPTGRRSARADSKSKRKKPSRPVKRRTKSKSARRPASNRSRTAAKRPKPAARKAARKPVRKTAKKLARKAPPAPRKRPASRSAPPRAFRSGGTEKRPRLDRQRRTLDETVRTPPSSLDMDRRGSAVRTGRAEMAQHLAEHGTLTPDITAGDVDVDIEDAYFTGDETPGGDNSTPDQDVVDEIGKALGVEYEDGESLKGSAKVVERDKHRWELDPASAEDYKDRK